MNQDITGEISDLDRRVYRLEQQTTSPLHTSYFETIHVGPPGSEVPINMTPPDPVTDLAVNPGVLQNNSYVDVDWNGNAHSYEVRIEIEEDPNQWVVVRYIRTFVTNIRVMDLHPGRQYRVYVVPMSIIGVLGTGTGPVSFTAMKDTTPPSAPNGVVLSVGVTTAVVRWNENPEPDVSGASGLYEVQLDTTNTFNSNDGQPVHSARISGTLISFGDLETDTEYFARVRAIDSSDNESAWSAVVSGSTPAPAGRDFVTNPITETEISDGSISTPKLQANIIESSHLVTDTAVITTSAQIAEATIDDAHVSELSAAKITFGEMSGDRIQVNSLSAQALKASNLTVDLGITTGRLSVGSGPSSTGVYIDSSGIRLFSGSNLRVHLDAVTGNATFTGTINATSGTFSGNITSSATITGGTFRTSGFGSRVEITSSAADRIRFYDSSGILTHTLGNPNDGALVMSGSLATDDIFAKSLWRYTGTWGGLTTFHQVWDSGNHNHNTGNITTSAPNQANTGAATPVQTLGPSTANTSGPNNFTNGTWTSNDSGSAVGWTNTTSGHAHTLPAHTHNATSHTHTLSSHTHHMNTHTHWMQAHTHTLVI